jgi:hypothetical protein
MNVPKDRSYAKESTKTNPSGIRFDKEQLEFIQKRESKLNTKQKVVDFLLNKYWWEFKVKLEPNHKGLPPVSEIKPIEQPKSNYQVNTAPKPTNPILSKFQDYKELILATRTVKEIEGIMMVVKNDEFLTVGEKRNLDGIAINHSRDFYND